MQPQKKKSHTVVLLIGWLIILGSYLLIRLAFILFGLHLRSEALGVCLAIIPYLLAALYFGKYGKSQKAWFYSLGILFPSIVEKIALYSIGAFLYGIASANISRMKSVKIVDKYSRRTKELTIHFTPHTFAPARLGNS